jgi:CubicO group peptidase (beta-lactamase class C family)
MPSLAAADSLLRQALADVAPAAQAEVRWRNEILLSRAYGWLDPETRQRPTQSDTLFDLASVTKLFATASFMQLVDEGRVALDQPVKTLLPEFDGPRPIQPYEDPLRPGALIALEEAAGVAEAGRVTFRHLLAHKAGLPAWRPIFQQAEVGAALALALNTPFAYPIGARVVYSDIGLILLGLAIERLTGQTLDAVIAARVTGRLGLNHTRYLPTANRQSLDFAQDRSPNSNIAPTEFCQWRNRRIVGEVHDENAWRLGGVSAHAGLFANAADVACFGQMFLNDGRPVLKPETVGEMTRPQAEHGTTRRGLGFVLWSTDPEASGNPFSPRAFGHTGFTGTSLWIDPERALVVALLTNRVYHGRERGGIAQLRVVFHRALVEAVDAPASAVTT